MPNHVMLSYQWDDQTLVKRVYDRLKEDGFSVWMDIEGGVSGNINDAMAAGVEEAVVMCPFMTPAYQASRSCKKELSYADVRQVPVVPIMVTRNWEASEWLGLLTAGQLWVDFRNVDRSHDHFDKCVRSLEEEIMFVAGNVLTIQEPTYDTENSSVRKKLKQKPGRGFRHALTQLYLWESGEQKFHPVSDTRNTVELSYSPGDNGFWEEIKSHGCKHYRNVVTNGYLGFDHNGDYVYTKASPYGAEEWLLMVDETDHSYERAVVIKNKHSQKFLAVRQGRFIGLPSYTEECKWFLE
ncbi:hypothetical protein ACEWY4_007408 [Coilia grayii]|uniref:TIR domain-containing protein n=1 Tax=Coilia grayii TaxID=363190 RepID=A0ABD1KG55_9TELE